jgi:hypothetical protein
MILVCHFKNVLIEEGVKKKSSDSLVPCGEEGRMKGSSFWRRRAAGIIGEDNGSGEGKRGREKNFVKENGRGNGYSGCTEGYEEEGNGKLKLSNS